VKWLKLPKSKAAVTTELYLAMKRDKEHFASLAFHQRKLAIKHEARCHRLEHALSDALGAFTGNGQLVTEERLEAWKSILNGGKK
jgi:hypothetical protein